MTERRMWMSFSVEQQEWIARQVKAGRSRVDIGLAVALKSGKAGDGFRACVCAGMLQHELGIIDRAIPPKS